MVGFFDFQVPFVGSRVDDFKGGGEITSCPVLAHRRRFISGQMFMFPRHQVPVSPAYVLRTAVTWKQVDDVRTEYILHGGLDA